MSRKERPLLRAEFDELLNAALPTGNTADEKTNQEENKRRFSAFKRLMDAVFRRGNRPMLPNEDYENNDYKY